MLLLADKLVKLGPHLEPLHQTLRPSKLSSSLGGLCLHGFLADRPLGLSEGTIWTLLCLRKLLQSFCWSCVPGCLGWDCLYLGNLKSENHLLTPSFSLYQVHDHCVTMVTYND